MAVFVTYPLDATLSVGTGGSVINLTDTGSIASPSGSSSPFSLDTSNDDVTVSETGYFLFTFYARTVNTGGAPGDTDWIKIELQTDDGAGSWSGATTLGTAWSFHRTASTTSMSLTEAISVTSGDMFRLYGTSSTGGYTVSDGALTIWRDDTAGGVAPTGASYLVAASDGDLTDERVATSGEGVSVVSTSSAGTAIFNLDVPGLTAYTGAGSSDFLVVYDNTAKQHKKLTWSELFLVRDVQYITTSALTAMNAPPETVLGLAEHIDANITSGALSGDRAADAVTILEHYRDNGTNSGIAMPAGQRAILQAILKLKRYQAFESGTDT